MQTVKTWVTRSREVKQVASIEPQLGFVLVIKVTIVKAIAREDDVDVISASFSTALTSTPVYAARFAKILSVIVDEKGCTYLQPYLTSKDWSSTLLSKYLCVF